MAVRSTDIGVGTILGIRGRRETDGERIARHGWEPFVACSFCGDTGYNPDYAYSDLQGGMVQVECQCIVGLQLARRYTLELDWLNIAPKRFQNYTLDTHPNEDLVNRVHDWLMANPITTGQNLVIQGGVGRGKTGVAIAALREMHFGTIHDTGEPITVQYWSMPYLMDILRKEEFERKEDGETPTWRRLIRCDCLLLDDIGAERSTPFAEDRIFLLIDGRYNKGKPTILTTNLNPAKFGERDRVASRIRENHVWVTAKGPDYRREG
jgi:DNA replication protein DnaC